MNKIASRLARFRGIALLAGCAMDMGGGAASALGHPLPSRPADRARPRSRSSRPIPPTRAASNSRQLAAPVERELTRLGWTVEPRQRPLRAGRRWSASTRARGPRARRAASASASASAAAATAAAAASASAVGGTIPVGGGGQPDRRHPAWRAHPAPLRRDRRLGGPGRDGGARRHARWPARRRPRTGSPRPCFGTSPGSRGALSGCR